MVKKRTTGILFFSVPAVYFFLFRLYTRIHNTFFPKKQQLPFTPGGTHCPEPDVTLRDLTLSPGYHSDYAPQPIPEMDSSAVVPPTNENTSPPEDTPDNTPAGGNTGQAEKTRNSGLTPIPEKRSGMPPEHLRFATGFPPQPKIVCHRVSTATEDCRSQRKADAHRASG